MTGVPPDVLLLFAAAGVSPDEFRLEAEYRLENGTWRAVLPLEDLLEHVAAMRPIRVREPRMMARAIHHGDVALMYAAARIAPVSIEPANIEHHRGACGIWWATVDLEFIIATLAVRAAPRQGLRR